MLEAEIDRIKYIVCCPLCDNSPCCRGTDKCDAEIWAKRKKLEEMDEHTKVTLQHVAAVAGMNMQDAVSMADEMAQAFSKAIAPVAEKIGDLFVELPDLPRPPAEIRKDIKHEKNPLRLRQLNKELNESYKAYKRR